jgi:hypothetical protein
MSDSDLQAHLEQARQEYGLACDLAEDPSQPRLVRENARKKRRSAGRRIDRCLNEQKRRQRQPWRQYEQEKQAIQRQNLAPADYEKRMAALTTKLGL